MWQQCAVLIVIVVLNTIGIVSGACPAVLFTSANTTTCCLTNYLTLTDLNTDGKLDLVTSNLQTSNARVFLGDGNGTFSSAGAYPTGNSPKCVAVADFNGDRIPDIVVSNYSSSTVSILKGIGN